MPRKQDEPNLTPEGSAYTVLPADLGRDRIGILDLWTRNLHWHTSEQHSRRLDWVYRQNPLGTGWLFLARQSRTGRIVGTAGVGLRKWADDSVAGVAVDFVVDADHRTAQPALLMARSLASAVNSRVRLLYGFPNRSALAIFKRVGYEELGPAKGYVKLLQSTDYLRRRGVSGGALKIASSVIDFGLRFSRAELSRSRAVAVELHSSDSRLNQFLKTLPLSGVETFAKTAEILHWRYELCPLHQYSLLGVLAADHAKHVIGVAACYTHEGGLMISDLIYPEDLALLESVFSALIRWSRERKLKAVIIEVANARPMLLAALRRFRFVDRFSTESLVVYRPKTAGLGPKPWVGQMFRDR